MKTFEVSIDVYDFALQQAHDEIEEATGTKLPNATKLTLEFLEIVDETAFYRVTLEGPEDAEIAAAVNELQEPCPPPKELRDEMDN